MSSTTGAKKTISLKEARKQLLREQVAENTTVESSSEDVLPQSQEEDNLPVSRKTVPRKRGRNSAASSQDEPDKKKSNTATVSQPSDGSAPLTTSRSWVFTLNNPQPEEDPNDWPESLVQYCTWQLEKADSGTPHFQGYVLFKKAVSLKKDLKPLCSRANWQIRYGTHAEARDYCNKELTRVEGPFSRGVDPQPPVVVNKEEVSKKEENEALLKVLQKFAGVKAEDKRMPTQTRIWCFVLSELTNTDIDLIQNQCDHIELDIARGPVDAECSWSWIGMRKEVPAELICTDFKGTGVYDEDGDEEDEGEIVDDNGVSRRNKGVRILGYINFARTTRASAVKSLFRGNCVWSPRFNTHKYTVGNLSDITNVEDGFIIPSPGYYETGSLETAPPAGAVGRKKADDKYARIKEMIDNGADNCEIAEVDFKMFLVHYKAIDIYRHMKAPKRREKTKCIAIWGESGSGKSKFVLDLFGVDSERNVFWKRKGQWWDGYKGQEVVVFDEFYGGVSYSELLQMTDVYPYSVEIKGGTYNFAPKLIIFTSNCDPRNWYKMSHKKPGINDVKDEDADSDAIRKNPSLLYDWEHSALFRRLDIIVRKDVGMPFFFENPPLGYLNAQESVEGSNVLDGNYSPEDGPLDHTIAALEKKKAAKNPLKAMMKKINYGVVKREEFDSEYDSDFSHSLPDELKCEKFDLDSPIHCKDFAKEPQKLISLVNSGMVDYPGFDSNTDIVGQAEIDEEQTGKLREKILRAQGIATSSSSSKVKSHPASKKNRKYDSHDILSLTQIMPSIVELVDTDPDITKLAIDPSKFRFDEEKKSVIVPWVDGDGNKLTDAMRRKLWVKVMTHPGVFAAGIETGRKYLNNEGGEHTKKISSAVKAIKGAVEEIRKSRSDATSSSSSVVPPPLNRDALRSYQASEEDDTSKEQSEKQDKKKFVPYREYMDAKRGVVKTAVIGTVPKPPPPIPVDETVITKEEEESKEEGSDAVKEPFVYKAFPDGDITGVGYRPKKGGEYASSNENVSTPVISGSDAFSEFDRLERRKKRVEKMLTPSPINVCDLAKSKVSGVFVKKPIARSRLSATEKPVYVSSSFKIKVPDTNQPTLPALLSTLKNKEEKKDMSDDEEEEEEEQEGRPLLKFCSTLREARTLISTLKRFFAEHILSEESAKKLLAEEEVNLSAVISDYVHSSMRDIGEFLEAAIDVAAEEGADSAEKKERSLSVIFGACSNLLTDLSSEYGGEVGPAIVSELFSLHPSLFH